MGTRPACDGGGFRDSRGHAEMQSDTCEDEHQRKLWRTPKFSDQFQRQLRWYAPCRPPLSEVVVSTIPKLHRNRRVDSQVTKSIFNTCATGGMQEMAAAREAILAAVSAPSYLHDFRRKGRANSRIWYQVLKKIDS